jgi:hypothetical protein
VTCTAFKCVCLVGTDRRAVRSVRRAWRSRPAFATQTWCLKAIKVSRPHLVGSAQIIGRVRLFFGQCIDIADFDVGWLQPRPFAACTQKPVALSDDTRRMKPVTWDKKLHALTAAQIRTDKDALSRPIGAQHQDFNWMPEVRMIKLIIADTVQTDALVSPALP